MANSPSLLFVTGHEAGAQGLGLRVGEEFRSIQTALTKAGWSVQPCFGARYGDLTSELFALRPAVVHFAAHARGNGLGLLREMPYGAVQDDLSPTQIAEVFRQLVQRRSGPRLVVFNCCHSLPMAEAAAEFVANAVGTVAELADEVALEFSRLLYGYLGERLPIETAFQLAHNAFGNRSLPADALPRLICRPAARRRRRRTGECPFVVGRALVRGETVGRQEDARFVLERVRNGESVYIHGDPRIGKSSLLKMVLDREEQTSRFGDEAGAWLSATIDAHGTEADYDPSTFWRDAFRSIVTRECPPWLRAAIAGLDQRAPTNDDVRRFFAKLERHGWTMLLGIDEVDVLAARPRLDADFWARLRSLSSNAAGLTLIVVSRWPRAKLQGEVRGRGSECFNQMSDRELFPLDDGHVEVLLARGDLAPEALAFARRVGGQLPWLLQTTAQRLWYREPLERCAREVIAHADVVFPALLDLRSPEEVTAAFALALEAVRNEAPPSALMAARLRAHGSRLVPRGLTDTRGPPWVLAPMAFAWWACDSGIPYVRQRAERLPVEDERAVLGALESLRGDFDLRHWTRGSGEEP